MRPFLASLSHALRWHRRLVAAACAAVAAYAVLATLSTDADGTAVVVAAHGISGGQIIEASDLATVRLPAAAVPDGAVTDPGEVVGRAVAASVPARGVLTESDLVTGGGIVEAGRVALPVAFASSSPVELLRVGDRIDLLGVGPSGATEVVVDGVRVAALPEVDAGGMFSGGGSRIVLIDLSPAEAAKVTAAASASALAFALR